MNEVSELRRLIKKIQEDKDFAKRNLSNAIQLIPYIGGFITSNTIDKDNDEKLERRLLAIEKIAAEAISKEKYEETLNTLEQHSLIINSFLIEYQDKLFVEPIEIKPITIGLSFVAQDIEIAHKIVKQLNDNHIEVITNNIKLAEHSKADYQKVLSPNIIECLILIYTENYNSFNSSAYNDDTYLNFSKKRKVPILTFAFDSIIKNNILQLSNTFSKTFNKDEIENLIPTFFFEKFKEVKKIEQDLLEKYSDIDTILRQYNSDFQKIHSFEKGRIAFELYQLKQLTGKDMYCLYLYNNINSKKTIEYIQDHFKNEKILDNFFILINRQKELLHPEKRIDYIKKLFKSDPTVYFIDDFVWERLTSKFFNEFKEKPIDNFIKPYLRYQKDRQFDNFNFIDNWLYQENNPILILTGSGGIGKTTLAKKIANRINITDNKTKAIYIDAIKISRALFQLSQNDQQIDLYSFYKISESKNNADSINYELFRINIDNGNIVIIIDGLDEIISRLGDYFNVNDFFKSIEEFTKEVGNGKIILTSRNYFWDTTKSNLKNIEVLDILPFTKEKAREFFEKRYPNSEKLVKKALSISESILGHKITDDYIPYVLESVCFILEDSVDNGKYYDPDFDSDILNQNVRNDYILGKICVRETERTEQVSVDKQLRLFFELAFNNINESDIKYICSKIFEGGINDRQIEAFKAHPLLALDKQNNITFKYDFFKNHIKGIYLYQLLKSEENIDKNHIDILNTLVDYNSSFNVDLIDRIEKIDDIIKFRVLSLIEEIKNETILKLTEKTRRKSISSLFVILLKLDHKNRKVDIAKDTALMELIFKNSSGVIDNVNIIDLTCSSNDKIIFDFRGKVLNNSYFQSYDYFWNCKFDKNTLIENSTFYSLHKEKKYNTSATKVNFKNIKGEDATFSDIINGASLKNDKRDLNIINDLHNFISFFCSNGQTEYRNSSQISSKYQRKVVKFDLLIKVLEKNELIVKYISPSNKEQIKINDKYENDVLRFFSNRLPLGIIKESFNLLKEKTK